MALFAFYCRDGDGGPELRKRHLDAHLAHVEAHIDHYALAGPLRERGAIIGSLLIIHGADEAQARARFEADPYFKAGIWQSIRVSAFTAAAGEWLGGVTWKD